MTSEANPMTHMLWAESREAGAVSRSAATTVPPPVRDNQGRPRCPKGGTRLAREQHPSGVEWMCWQCGYRWYGEKDSPEETV